MGATVEETITVLVVDDEAMLRRLLEKVLKKEGYNVHLAPSAKDALEILRDNTVDIIISDIRMPEMDGFALLKAVKDKYPNVGIIMMTGYADAYTVKDALLLGADDYITKPFKSAEICMIVERAYWRALSNRDNQTKPVAN
jgi:DNA-binding NtrC family response regulator